MRALVIQHDHVSPPGPVGERLSDRGYDVRLHLVVPEDRYDTPGVESTLPELTDYDVVVPMGAPWSAYDTDRIGSWVLPEIAALRDADAAGVPVLGICFGGQLLATAHGGSVARSPLPEVGWRQVTSDEEELVASGPWFQWHYDRWTVPAEATEIARNDSASQAFVLRRNLAVQFHPELTSDMLVGWLDNGGRVELERAGIDAEELVSGTRARDEVSRTRAHRLVDAFLATVAPTDPTARRELCGPGSAQDARRPIARQPR